MAKTLSVPGASAPALNTLPPELRAVIREAVKVALGSSPDKLAYSIDDLCAAGSLGRQMIYDQIASGALRAKKCGDRTVILREEAERWLSALPDWTSRPRGRAAQNRRECQPLLNTEPAARLCSEDAQ